MLGTLPNTLRIVHVLRAPVGGLFRHVLDLSREQIARGHHVGLITDTLTGGITAERQLAELQSHLSLGLLRLPIHRLPHYSDISALLQVGRRLRDAQPDVIHGHGSKGGVYARASRTFPSLTKAVRAYTPHGGSLNYRPGTRSNRAFMGVERLLSYATDVLLFESAFIAGRFHEFVGEPQGLERIIPNGISPTEFEPVAPLPDAADLLYVGEFRAAKGLDTLIDALSLLAKDDLRPTLVMVGDGPETKLLTERAHRAGVGAQLTLRSRMAAREAFTLGKTMIVPSRFESLPYIVLEAAGALLPLIATNVGGMPEIYGPYADRLIACDDPEALATALRKALTEHDAERRAKAQELHDYVASRFTIKKMVDEIIQGYRDAIDARSAV